MKGSQGEGIIAIFEDDRIWASIGGCVQEGARRIAMAVALRWADRVGVAAGRNRCGQPSERTAADFAKFARVSRTS